ncbi:MAG: RnfABCDGE type electron transport complex subunit D [Blautia sp.]|nr:RnfABCDGE type electron transport complex subunit D [Blautia sp.]
MSNLLNVSSNPHARTEHDTLHEMYNVILALIPVTVFGVAHFGLHSLIIVVASILSAMVTEYVFDRITHRKNSLWDGSAVVTGLLLALVLPPTVPIFIPVVGSMFGILFVKCFFGGLGQNFMNPALAARAFLLISFGTLMTNYSVDGTSSATPLAVLKTGGSVNTTKMLLGFVDGHIGISIICLLIGGLFLLIKGTITWQIPICGVLSFAFFMGVLGGKGFDPQFLAAHICGGGLILGVFFMATDPVTSPISAWGQALYGIFVGALAAVFRVFGNMADSMTYAIIIANLLVPLIDLVIIPRPFGIGRNVQYLLDDDQNGRINIPKSALILMLIALLTGGALAGVNYLTAPTIAENQLAANLAAFEAVLPEAESFEYDDAVTAKVEEAAAASDYYADGAFGKVMINEVVAGKDASGETIGYALSVTTMEGFEGEITQSVGISADGTVQGIAFTVLAETAGMGMRVDEPDWKSQFAGKQVDQFTLLKSGGASSDEEIDSISGASTTSGAVVNAVNAALDFYHTNLA